MWQKVKEFFVYSETLFWARFQVFVGLVTAALATVDWSPFFSLFGISTGFDWKQTLWIGAGLMINGIWLEYLRRRNTKETPVGLVSTYK